MSTDTFPPYDSARESPDPELSTSARDPLATTAVGTSPDTSHDSDPASTAQDAAGAVADDAGAAAKHVAGTAKDQASGVASEAKSQARDLYHQTTSELREQAGTQQKRVAGGLRSAGEQLDAMADGADSGMASDAVRSAARRASSAAEWLDQRDPGTLLDEVRGFAARRPGVFIAAAAIGGVLAGRLTKSLVENAKSDGAATTPRDGGEL